MKLIFSVFAYLIIILFAVRYGSVFVSWDQFELLDPIVQLRLFRVITGSIVGALLSVSGYVLQQLMRNPIVDSHILGITSAGTFGALVTILIFGSAVLSLQITGALVLSLSCVALVLALRSLLKWGDETLALPLLGFLINAFFGALTMLFFVFASPGQLTQAYSWLLGSLHPLDKWMHVLVALVLSLAGILVVKLLQPVLMAAQFGDKFVLSLGYRLSAVRQISLLVVCLFSTIIVVLSGSIGFVGLLVPHFVKHVFKRNSDLVFANVICGAGFVVLADLLSRWIFAPAEIPVGVFTALMGVPMFGFVLFGRRS